MKKFIYRCLRNNMVMRLRRQGLSWATINKVLMACEQKVATHYVISEDRKGLTIHFGQPKRFRGDIKKVNS